jgi:hypothetical protein
MGSIADDVGPGSSPRPPARKPRPTGDGGPATARATAAAASPSVAAKPAVSAPRPAAPAPTGSVVPATYGATERRYRQTIRKVDLWSVLKISVCFYLCGMAVTMIALAALWLIADAVGVVHSVEHFFGDLLQTKNFTFLSGSILMGALLVSAVIVVLQIVITVIAASFYNLFAELFGGIEVTISEDESVL